MGVASFVIAIIAMVGTLLELIVVVGISSTFATPPENSPINVVFGAWVFAIGVLGLIGIVFGIGGLLQKNRRRHLAVVGLCVSIFLPVVLLTFLLMCATVQGPHDRVGREPIDLSPSWDSLFARGSRALTGAIALGVVTCIVARRRNRGTRRSDPSHCARCRANVRPGARFCTRCGIPSLNAELVPPSYAGMSGAAPVIGLGFSRPDHAGESLAGNDSMDASSTSSVGSCGARGRSFG